MWSSAWCATHIEDLLHILFQMVEDEPAVGSGSDLDLDVAQQEELLLRSAAAATALLERSCDAAAAVGEKGESGSRNTSVVLGVATSIAAKYLVGKDAAQARLAQRVCAVLGSLSSCTVRDILIPHADQLRRHFCEALHLARVKLMPHVEALGHTVALLFILELKLPGFLGTSGYTELLGVNMRRDVSKRLTPRRIATLKQLKIANLKALRAVLFQSDTSTLALDSSKRLVLLFAHESVVSLMSTTAEVRETGVEALTTLMDPPRAASHPALGAAVAKIVDTLVNVMRQFERLRVGVVNGIARVVAAAPARFVAVAGGDVSLRAVLLQSAKRWLQQASDSVSAPQRRSDYRLLDSILLVMQNMAPDESDMSDLMGLWCTPQLRHPYIAPLARYASAHPAAALDFAFPPVTGGCALNSVTFISCESGSPFDLTCSP